MESYKKKPIRKILLIVAIIIVTIVSISIIGSYLILHNYINKMNLVSTEDNTYNLLPSKDETDLQPEFDSSIDLADNSESPDISDSPEDEVTSLEEEIRNNMEANQTPIMQDKDVFNILLIGSDTRKTDGRRGLSDAMIIISINKKTKTTTATSILRDIYLQIPGKQNNRINAAYALGGADLLMDTIEQNFKIQVDRYASIDFFAFIDIVDAVGGVTLEVTEKEIPVINKYITEINRLTNQEETLDHLIEPGTLLLNGKQALGYARNRYIGNNDFERTARQRRVLEQVFHKIKDIGLLELNSLMNKILPQVTTNLTQGEIFSMILSLPSYAKYDLQQWSIPVNGSYSNMRIRGMAVLGIDFDKNIKEIQKRIYGVEENQ